MPCISGKPDFIRTATKAAVDGVDPAAVDEFAQINDRVHEDIDWIRTQPSPYVATNSRFPSQLWCARYLSRLAKGRRRRREYPVEFQTAHAAADGKRNRGRLGADSEVSCQAALSRTSGDQGAIVTAVGAWGLFLSLSRNLEPDVAWSLALGWSGEQLFVYAGASPNEDETALIWQLETADEAAGSALEEALRIRGSDRSGRANRELRDIREGQQR